MFHILSKIREVGPYRPTIRDVRLWFAVLNEIIFNGKVPKFKYVNIVDKRGQLGACHSFVKGDDIRWCELDIHHEFKSFSLFLAVLGHEMIHCYQYCVLRRDMSHGQYFWTWAKKFRKHKLPLQIRY